MQHLLDITKREKFVVTCLIIGAILMILLGLVSVLINEVYPSSTYVYDAYTSDFAASIYVILGILTIVVYVLSVVSFCMWAFRAMDNVHRSPLNDVQHTPGWTVGWFFIPIAYLWKPYQALKEVYQGSLYICGNGGINWKNAGPTSSVGYWFGFWLASNIFTNVATRLDPNSEESVLVIVEVILFLVSSYFAIKMIREIGNMQRNPRRVQDMAVGGYFPETNTPQGYRPDGVPVQGNYPPQQVQAGTPLPPATAPELPTTSHANYMPP